MNHACYCFPFSILFRGFADFKKKVFRKWYSNLIELRSLLGSNICFALFTATASRLMELKIFESLGLTPDDFTCVVLDPDRKNICYQVQMVPKVSLSIIFDFVLRDIFEHGDSSTRRLIYCQTRKQCAILYNMFLLKLGSSMYSGGVEHPKKRRVDMFHGGTADSVKSHILEEISKEDSHIRVVICTIAFGMGVNAKGINESIHFGPSKSITSFVQESGRIGREGKPSVSRLFHTITLTGKVDTKMKEFVHSKDQCRRKILLSLFSNSTSAEYGCGCECCDICALKCECSISKWAPIDFTLKPQNNDSKSRKTSDSALSLLHEKLDEFRRSFLEFDVKPVGVPSVYMEFDHYQVKSLVKNASKIFCVTDVYFYGFVWRWKHAKRVLKIFNEVFEDIDELFSSLNESMPDFHNSQILIGNEWYEIANDTSMFDTLSDSIMNSLRNDTQQSE